MGALKRYVEEEIVELAKLLGLSEEDVYRNYVLYEEAVKLAGVRLNEEIQRRR